MPKHRWSLLCRHAVVDKYTNLLSILDVVDEAELRELPDERPEGRGNAAIALDAQFVTVWERSNPERPERFVQAVTVTFPGGELHDSGVRIEGDLSKHRRTRLIIALGAVTYGGPGTYLFNVHLEKNGSLGKIIDSVPFNFKPKKEEASSA